MDSVVRLTLLGLKEQCSYTLLTVWLPWRLSSKEPPGMQETQETWVWSLGREDPLKKEMSSCSNILAWRIPWTEEPGRLQSCVTRSWTWLNNWVHVCVCVCTHTQSIQQWSPFLSANRTLDYSSNRECPLDIAEAKVLVWCQGVNFD